MLYLCDQLAGTGAVPLLQGTVELDNWPGSKLMVLAGTRGAANTTDIPVTFGDLSYFMEDRCHCHCHRAVRRGAARCGAVRCHRLTHLRTPGSTQTHHQCYA